jgi:hypothetical protein
MKQEQEQLFDFQSKESVNDYAIKPLRFFKKSLSKNKMTAFNCIGILAINSYVIFHNYHLAPNIWPQLFSAIKNHPTIFHFLEGGIVSQFTQDMLSDNLPLHKFTKKDYTNLQKNGSFLTIGSIAAFGAIALLSSKISSNELKAVVQSVDIALSIPIILGISAVMFGLFKKGQKTNKNDDNIQNQQEEKNSSIAFFKK